MDPRSSRLLSGRRVPSRHSARFISRSALAIAIDALSRRALRPSTVPPRGVRAKARAEARAKARARTLRHGPWLLLTDRSDADEVADEDQRLAGGDRAAARAAVAVGEVRGDGQLATAADLHALDALVPAGDDLAGTELELQRGAAVPGGVELLAGGEGDTDVVHGDGLSRLGHRSVALPDFLDLQVGRRLATREVDLGLVDAH